jgi:hypothetical protein
MNVANITDAAISQGLTPAFCACWPFTSAIKTYRIYMCCSKGSRAYMIALN